MIHAHTGIHCEPLRYVVTIIYIACYLIAIALAALLVLRLHHLACLLRCVVGIAIDVLIVNAHCKACTLKQSQALI